MPDFNDAIQDLPQSFRREKQELDRAGIHRWSSIRALTDLQLSQLARSGQASPRNLKRLRGMADLVCGLELPPQDAARRRRREALLQSLAQERRGVNSMCRDRHGRLVGLLVVDQRRYFEAQAAKQALAAERRVVDHIR